MYGKIIDPEYYVDVWPQGGRISQHGPFANDYDAEEELIALITDGNPEQFFSMSQIPNLVKTGDRSWYDEENMTEYSIIEKEKE